jgi:hypothetical protein
MSSIPAPSDNGRSDITDVSELVRIGTMLGALLEEARSITMDEAGRRRLAEVHEHAIEAIRHAVSAELQSELTTLDFSVAKTASEPELRLAQAQLIGWLNGVLLGVRAAAIQSPTPAPPVALESRRGSGGYA